MTCADVTTRLESVLGGDLSVQGFMTASTRSHLAVCSGCEQAWALVQLALDEAGRLEEGLSESLPRVRAELRQAFARHGRPLIKYDRLLTPIGTVFVGVSDRGLYDVTFDAPNESAYRRRLARRVPELHRDRSAVEPVMAQLDDYFSGRRHSFSLDVDLRGVSQFTSRVLSVTRQIPFGELLRYGDIAHRLGSPGASRAVGGALGRNPVPIVVPCHRVVAGGGLGGFTGGLDTKRALLAHEGHRGYGRAGSDQGRER